MKHLFLPDPAGIPNRVFFIIKAAQTWAQPFIERCAQHRRFLIAALFQGLPLLA
jgi:hypothetical protein